MTMKSINIAELKREQILIAAAVILVISFGQFMLMRTLTDSYAELSALSRVATTVKNSVEGRSNAIMQYKQSVKIEGKDLPQPIDSQNKFYAILLGLLSAQGFDKADVTSAQDSAGNVSFKVSGEANYHQLLYLIASFRQGSYMMRLTDLSLEGEKDNAVKYSFTVSARVAGAAQAAEEGTK